MVSVGFANPTLCITPRLGFPFFVTICYIARRVASNHPENNLAKFGYILDIKVDPKKNNK
jgi:hypothetical protein